MLALLKGTIVEKEANRLILDVRDVGYEVLVPLSTYYELGEVGDPAELRIHTHVKEDALSLFGFKTDEEKKLFSLMIQISGIGPKLAVTILSGLPPEQFVDAIRAEDLVRLNRIPGVGKKTAERLVLELRDKLASWAGSPGEKPAESSAKTAEADVISALVNLGYPRNQAESRVTKAGREVGDDKFDVLLRKALSY